MEWIFENSFSPTSVPTGSLGTQVGDSYEISSDCLLILSEITKKLSFEDRIIRNFRRSIVISETLKKDFIPILVNIKDVDIIDLVIRILVNLLLPVECLLPIETMSKTEVGRTIIMELNNFLINSKESFVDPRTTRVIIDHMKKIIEMEEKKKLTEKECDSINNCLLLLRNVLHIPETKVPSHCTIQNQIIWNLFVQNIDKVLIHLMTCDQKNYWGVTMVQLIAVMYKDQHKGTLQKLLNLWFEASLSESSEDNESNTSPPEQGSDSSPVLTSDPTSDSSDTGGGGHKSTNNHEGSSGVPHVIQRPSPSGAVDNNKVTGKASSIYGQHNLSSRSKQNPDGQHQKRECFSPEMSDCGYGTQADNPEFMSTSSNEEETPQMKRPTHQKFHNQKIRYCNKQVSIQEKKELRRKKLVKRSKTTIVNIKAMAHHVPTSEDITHILKEFTVDFLLKAFGSLVQVLHSQLLLQCNLIRIDTSHFFWLVTYFLKFAAQLELDLEHIRDVLSYDILSYLTYEGVNISESLEIASRQGNVDLKPFLRRQHLVITAIREFIQAIETYGEISHLSTEDKEFLRNLQTQISSTDDLKCMFVLLLRQFDPNIHNKQYLQDLIVTNHILLTFLETSSNLLHNKFGLSLINHIKQFATVEVMRQYGILLEDFESNGEYINDCVFTMMHHIGGDMNQVASLFQPNILKTFTQIWEGDFQICDDWSDLIEYVIRKFINLSRHCPFTGSNLLNSSTESDTGSWSMNEEENLSSYFTQSSLDTCPTSKMIQLYEDSKVVRRLMEQGVITPMQYKNFLQSEELNSPKLRFLDEDKLALENGADEINYLRDLLIKDNRGPQLSWLQRLLIEVCYVKLVKDLNYKIIYDPISRPLEPIPHYYSHLNQSIPVVSWNAEQADVLLLQPFQMLLHKLGFHLPADTGKVFARIPSFWTVDVLFSVAQKLGPIDFSSLKFEMKYLTERFGEYKKQEGDNNNMVQNEDHHYGLPKTKNSNLIKFAHISNSTYHWFDIVNQNNAPTSLGLTERKLECPEAKNLNSPNAVKSKECDTTDSDIASVCSICETSRGSVASDLTRMCMSDEEQTFPVSATGGN